MTLNQDKGGNWLSWSGGKDSALTLHQLIENGGAIDGLLTTVTDDYDRISMHGVRRSLLQKQAASLGCKLKIIRLPSECSNKIYEKRMQQAMSELVAENAQRVSFGDIFLEDVREYREAQFEYLNLSTDFPIWNQSTSELMNRFMQAGFRAVVVCLDPDRLDPSFLGRELNSDFVADLPAEVDPCGENGEFHTFVYDGPVFDRPIPFTAGERIVRRGFHFIDLVPKIS